MTEVVITLSDEIAKRAKEAGLLERETLELVLKGAMREKSLDRLFTTMDRLERLTPALTEAEIAAEIEAARRERRR
jgi:hypothetical protein